MEEITKVQDGPGMNGASDSPSPFLIVLAGDRKIHSVHRPTGNNTSIGRSSRCDIRVQDPRFPRIAGEIVLNPVPLFRTSNHSHTGNNNHPLIKLQHGKPIEIAHYRLHVLRHGDVFRSHKTAKSCGTSNTPFKIGILLPILLLGIISLILFQFQKAASVASADARREVTVPFSLSEVIAIDQEKVKNHQTKDEAVSDPKKTPVDSEPEYSYPAPDRGGNRKTFHKDRNSNQTTSLAKPGIATGGINQNFLKTILGQATKRFSKGDPTGAGRLVSALLPLLSQDQRDLIIATLEPEAAAIFRHAYILRPYDREKADEGFQKLSISGLEILPSVRKAKRFTTESVK